MKARSKSMAFCGMAAALGVVLMLVGSFLGLGMYLVPMMVGAGLAPIGRRFGVRCHVMLWLAIGLLSLMLVPDVEQDLMFLGLFGWYPILRPTLQRLPRGIRACVKLLLFNVVILALEALVMLVLVPETLAVPLLAALLVLGNITFLLYDFVLPALELTVERYMDRLFPGN